MGAMKTYIHKDFAIAAGVNVTHILLKFGKILVRICQVAIVGERDAERRVDVKGLGLGGAGGAGGGVADVADAHLARQPRHVLLREHVAHLAVVLAQAQPAHHRAVHRG